MGSVSRATGSTLTNSNPSPSVTPTTTATTPSSTPPTTSATTTASGPLTTTATTSASGPPTTTATTSSSAPSTPITQPKSNPPLPTSSSTNNFGSVSRATGVTLSDSSVSKGSGSQLLASVNASNLKASEEGSPAQPRPQLPPEEYNIVFLNNDIPLMVSAFLEVNVENRL